METQKNVSKDVNDEGNTPVQSNVPIVISSVVTSDSVKVQSVVQPTSVTSKTIESILPPQKRAKTQIRVLPEVQKKETKGTLKSKIWGHFSFVEDSDPIKATCNYCSKEFAADPSKNGTSTLFGHIDDRCDKVPWKNAKGQKKMTDFAVPSESSKNTKSKPLNVDDIRTKLARMVIVDELPFNIVEGEGFIEYSYSLEPRFKVPSRVTIARDCMKIYIEERKKLKNELKGRRVCLTTDTWTSLQNLNYMVLTAHYVDDDWILHKKILNFCTIESHKGSMIACKLEDCLHGWGIDKILTLTLDNASSNDVCVHELLKDFKFKDVLLDNRFFHVRCHAHILNLVVKDGLKEYSSSIVRVRNACKYVRSSPARLKTFKECAEKEKLDLSHSVILDVDTRWNSTYMMLDRAEKYEAAFDRLYKHDKCFQEYFDDKGKVIGPPKKDDWIVARNFVTFLKLFYDVTLKFSTTSNATSHLCVPELCIVKESITEKMNLSSSSSMFDMASSMMFKYNKYWSNWNNVNHLVYVAIVLDPRYKTKGLDVCLDIMYGLECGRLKKDVEKHLNDLFSHYSMDATLSDKVSRTSPSRFGEQLGSEKKGTFALLSRRFGGGDENENKNELSTYLSDGLEKDEELNVLGWWKSNVLKYPILSTIAKDILAIPISTVASEQAFSTSGRVIDPFRSALNPSTVEALMCAQNWLRGSGVPVDIVEILDQCDVYEESQEERSTSCVTKRAIEVDSD